MAPGVQATVSRMTYPKTAAEFMALPTGGGFGSRVEVIDGVNVTIPVAPETSAVWVPDDGILSCADGHGATWNLGKHPDGSYFRRR